MSYVHTHSRYIHNSINSNNCDIIFVIFIAWDSNRMGTDVVSIGVPVLVPVNNPVSVLLSHLGNKGYSSVRRRRQLVVGFHRLGNFMWFITYGVHMIYMYIHIWSHDCHMTY